jgi:2-polyprenyl-6-methoxyphenol hydroxylase-like FAD-dependent oxidoreductase
LTLKGDDVILRGDIYQEHMEDAMEVQRHQVIVSGGGPAGIGAAIAAARAGARVLLVERYGFLGGMATTALVHPWMSHLAGDRPIIGGVFQEVVDRLSALGAYRERSFDPEVLKQVLLEMCLEANVRLRLHSFVTDAVRDGQRVCGIVVHSKSGGEVFMADCVVDCTGDADVAARSGAETEKGRPEDGFVQPMTLMFRMANVDTSRMPAREEINHLYAEAKNAGRIQCPRENVLWFYTTRPDEIYFNTTRVVEVDGTSAEDLTKAEIEARRQTWQIVEFLKREIPGFERSHLVATGPQIGVRETRRLVGQYVLTEEDVLSCRRFEDEIAFSSYPIDIHNPRGEGSVIKALPKGGFYGIPYRCLVPRDLQGFLVAGRPISTTHEAHSSARIQCVCYATGQAAGIAAAISAAEGAALSALDAEVVRAEIKKQGGILE